MVGRTVGGVSQTTQEERHVSWWQSVTQFTAAGTQRVSTAATTATLERERSESEDEFRDAAAERGARNATEGGPAAGMVAGEDEQFGD